MRDNRKELECFIHSFTDFFRAYRALFSLFFDAADVGRFLPFMSPLSSERIGNDSEYGFPYSLPFQYSSSLCSISSIVQNPCEPFLKNPPKTRRDKSVVYTNLSGNLFILPPADSGTPGRIRTFRETFPLPSTGNGTDRSVVSDKELACFRKYLFNAFPVQRCLQRLPRVLLELFLLIEETADIPSLQKVLECIGLQMADDGPLRARVQNLLRRQAIRSKPGYDGVQYVITETGLRDVIQFFADNRAVFEPLGIMPPDNFEELCAAAFERVSSSYGYRSKRGRALHDIRETRVYAHLLLSPSGHGPNLLNLSVEESASDSEPRRGNFRSRIQGNTSGVYADISEEMALASANADAPGNNFSLLRKYERRTLSYEIDNGTEQLELTPGSRNRQKELDARKGALAVSYNGQRGFVGDNAIGENSTISGKVRNYVRVFSRNRSYGDIIFIPFETAEEQSLRDKTGKAGDSQENGKSTPPAMPGAGEPIAGKPILSSAKSEGWGGISSEVLLRGYYLAAGGFAAENFQDSAPSSGLINGITCAELLRYLGKVAEEMGAILGIDEEDPTATEAVASLDIESYRGILAMRRLLSEYLQSYGGDSLLDKSRKPLSDFFRFMKEQSGDAVKKAPAVQAAKAPAPVQSSRGGFMSRSRAQNILRVLLTGSASAEIRLGIYNGLSISAVLPSRISELFFVTPERWFGKRGIISAVKSLGLLPDDAAGGAALSYHTPLAIDREEPRFVTRLCLWNEHVRIAIENISADIGGLVRARNYISAFPAGIGSRTVMLMLVSDSLSLADGSSLLDGTMTRDPDNHPVRYVNTARASETGSPATEMNYYFDLSDKNVGQLPEEVCEAIGEGAGERFYPHIPLLHGIDRDYVMVTYSDFLRAVLGEEVEAFTVFSRKKAFVRTRAFPEGRLPAPYRKPAGTMRYREYDMSSLLTNRR